MTAKDITAADLRSELARLGLPAYVIAARVPIHPSRLSSVLRERERMPRVLARRIWDVIQDEQHLTGQAR